MATDRWWSTPMEGNAGNTVIVTGHDNLDRMRESGKYPHLVRVSWDYNAAPDGMPDDIDADLMGQAADLLEEEFRRDKSALIAAIVTGEGRRDWIFYAHSLPIFGKVFNRALEPLEQTIPFVITAESDPDWSEYLDLRSQTYIPPEDSE